MTPYKFKTVSLKHDTYDKVGHLSKAITPGIKLSFASTIDYAVEKIIGDRLVSTNGKNNGITNGYNQEKASK